MVPGCVRVWRTLLLSISTYIEVTLSVSSKLHICALDSYPCHGFVTRRPFVLWHRINNAKDVGSLTLVRRCVSKRLHPFHRTRSLLWKSTTCAMFPTSNMQQTVTLLHIHGCWLFLPWFRHLIFSGHVSLRSHKENQLFPLKFLFCLNVSISISQLKWFRGWVLFSYNGRKWSRRIENYNKWYKRGTSIPCIVSEVRYPLDTGVMCKI